MSRYITKFSTEAGYTAALTSLEYPNVSLISETGDIKYSKFKLKEVYNANFGDILLANKNTNKLFLIEPNEYNTTDYSTTDFEPIAVCIWDKESHSAGETVFMSLKYMTYTNCAVGSYTSQDTYVSDYVAYQIGNTLDYVSDKDVNDYVKNNVISQDWDWQTPTDLPVTVTGKTIATGFAICWRFSTPGTSAGDWYLPTAYSLTKYRNNSSTINNIINNIVTAYTGSEQIMTNIWTSSEQKESSNYYMSPSNNSFFPNTTKKSWGVSVRAVLIVKDEQY